MIKDNFYKSPVLKALKNKHGDTRRRIGFFGKINRVNKYGENVSLANYSPVVWSWRPGGEPAPGGMHPPGFAAGWRSPLQGYCQQGGPCLDLGRETIQQISTYQHGSL